ncbi:MAG TPA: CHAT domain-containing protein [Herpetosiphonaceae bacterium]
MTQESGGLRQTAISRFSFAISDLDRTDLRWYLEDYLQHPYEPAPFIAARVEQRLREIGEELFHKIFESNRDATRLWLRLYEDLVETRVEIVSEGRSSSLIPWELLRDPQTNTPLALRARSFVRTLANSIEPPRLPRTSGPIRILLVICRPDGPHDVPFRSVASRLIKGLNQDARAAFDLHVLRPPTFQQLARVLRDAKEQDEPYHVVHFDGYGVYDEYQEAISINNPHVFVDRRPGKYGYLAFENHTRPNNFEPVDGRAIGRLLVETGVPVLVLIACRSAHADNTAEPQLDMKAAITTPPIADLPNSHEQVQAFGSLAQEVMDAGALGVVAMHYNVYVVTAAQFVAELYTMLTQGVTLGEAVTRGRKNLADQPLREVVSAPIPFADWWVPIIYEDAPVALFPKPERSQKLEITLNPAAATPTAKSVVSNVPPEPDSGFWGRDETLLALDRAFDMQSVVLLHAYAGSGKTTTAAEFARWYALTGGIDGPVLWTSFEHYTPLQRVLDTLGRVFEPLLEQSNIHWFTLTDDQRREVALQVLGAIPVLWIWDNVTPIAGFPSGTTSAWSQGEQRELADFLRGARQTQAKFLLTSRRAERGWLGDLPTRIQVPPMPMQERKQLARALAEKHGWKPEEVGGLYPLLVYTQGNPLTITVLVGQAVRDGLRTSKQIDDFLSKLQAGETTFEDETIEGRTKSLGASLSYGFERAFSDNERKILALLHFFQGFVDVDALRVMGDNEAPWCLPEVHNLTRKIGIELLDRAAEIGLLTAYGGGYYAIHPALPWYFKNLFEQYYEHPGNIRTEGQFPARAFVEAMGKLGDYYHNQYDEGNRNVINVLEAEEANLLHARQLARSNGWWSALTSTMQGLRILYEHTGRRVEWRRLVEEIVPDFVDLSTQGPLPGREAEWSLITAYRVRLAQEARQWREAEQLQRACVEWDRQRVASILTVHPDRLDKTQRNAIRTLAVSVSGLGNILREEDKHECITVYEEAIRLYELIGDEHTEAITAFNLGMAYTDVTSIRDLALAEHWYQLSLKLRDERDGLGRSRCLVQLGLLAYERFRDARATQQENNQLLGHLSIALQFYFRALELLPSNAVNDLAGTHHQLGNIYRVAGDLDRALPHYREAIRYAELADNFYASGQTRYNVAIALAEAGRSEDALLYAQAALRNFDSYGQGAAHIVQLTQRLIASIQEDMQSKT